MLISDFDYELPDDRIARFPAGERDGSKLLVWQRLSSFSHTVFRNIGDFLPRGSVLVFNDTRVVRARLVMFRPGPAVGVGKAPTCSSSADARTASTGVDTAVPASAAGPARGARVEIFCLEPHRPADYERAFAARGACEWTAMVGNAKRWKSGPVEIRGEDGECLLRAWRVSDSNNQTVTPISDSQEFVSNPPPRAVAGTDVSGDNFSSPHPPSGGADGFFEANTYSTASGEKRGGAAGAPPSSQIVRFEWDGDETFGELLERLGRVPIPPYLDRESEDVDNQRYQTVYAQREGSVAAPTAGLHFTPDLIERLHEQGVDTERVTLHVGAGTFLPVKTDNALDHAMHTERFEVRLETLERLAARLRTGAGNDVADISDTANFGAAASSSPATSRPVAAGEATGNGDISGTASCGHGAAGAADEVGGHLRAGEPVVGCADTETAAGPVVAVGTTSVRTLESLPVLAWRIKAREMVDESRRRDSQSAALGQRRAETLLRVFHPLLGDGHRSNPIHNISPISSQQSSRPLPQHFPPALTNFCEIQEILARPVGQFEWREVPAWFGGAEALDVLVKFLKDNGLNTLSASTRIMITPGFRFRIVGGLVTNFHQPRSTLLLLVSAFVGDGGPSAASTQQQLSQSQFPTQQQPVQPEPTSPTQPESTWRAIYDYALAHDFRFLSYGDSSLLLR